MSLRCSSEGHFVLYRFAVLPARGIPALMMMVMTALCAASCRATQRVAQYIPQSHNSTTFRIRVVYSFDRSGKFCGCVDLHDIATFTQSSKNQQTRKAKRPNTNLHEETVHGRPSNHSLFSPAASVSNRTDKLCFVEGVV